MFMIAMALSALAGGALIMMPILSSDDEETEDLSDDSLLEGEIIEEEGPDLSEPTKPPVDDTSLTGAAPDPQALVLPDMGATPYDAVPGDHLTDHLGGSLTTNAGPATDALVGTAFAEQLAAGDMADLIFGNEGDDTVEGLGGDDFVDGGAGADSLLGGDGQDVLRGMSGDDHLAGGQGNDLLTGDAGDDTLLGGAGNDHLFAGAGEDLLLGGAGDDLLDGSQYFEGQGDGGADTLEGGEGADTLALGAADVATGGAGNDVFVLGGSGVFEPSAEYPMPRVLDFDPETDRLELVMDGAGDEEITTLVENGGTTVLVDGTAVAHLDGVTSLDPGLIQIAAT